MELALQKMKQMMIIIMIQVFKELLKKYEETIAALKEMRKEQDVIRGQIADKLSELEKERKGVSKASERAEVMLSLQLIMHGQYFDKLDKACGIFMKMRKDLKAMKRTYQEISCKTHSLLGRANEFHTSRMHERDQIKKALGLV